MKNALLIIDMQNDFVLPEAPLHVAGAAATIPVIKKVLELARSRNWERIHIIRQHRRDGSDTESWRVSLFTKGPGVCVPGTDGARIVEELTPTADEHIIAKCRFSAFFQTSLDLLLRRLGVQNVIITGTQYPNCVRGTAVDAMSLDYRTIVVTDACSAQSEEIALSNIRDMRNMGIACITAAELEPLLEQQNG